MPHAFAKVYLHLVFSTKNRERIIGRDVQPELHRYIGGILKRLGCTPIEIGSEPEHVHALFLLSRTKTIADTVGAVKKSSNDWLKTKGPAYRSFYWQIGYSTFSVSESGVEDVRAYIRNQPEHHRKFTFVEEYRALLRKHGFDPDDPHIRE
jgi:REP element-mobilizing transposase RayT